jgi:ABC-2 type transport system ATP-binding protein
MEKVIEVRDLMKNFGVVRALRGISFYVNEGEIFGLIGPNGAGKTTTLRIISTLLQVTSGNVTIFGFNITRAPEEVRKGISYLPEDAGAYKNLSGRDYLQFMARFYSENGEKEEEILGRGVEIAKLRERINDRVSTYSKGMTRRLLVARALMVKPKLAVLDEPTSGLDVINSQEIRGIIRNFTRDRNAALISSHNMLEVELLCDRIALINDGLIVETGTPEDLKIKYNASNIEEVFMEVVK